MLIGWLGIKGSASVQSQLLDIQHWQDIIIKVAWETNCQVGLLLKEIMDMLLTSVVDDQYSCPTCMPTHLCLTAGDQSLPR